MGRRTSLLVAGAAGVLVSAYMHAYLYFWGGYRGISIDRVAGIDISRSFALNAIVGLLIAELLVLSLRFDRLALPAALAGLLFGLGALGAYALARTDGLLGFTESGWSTEAVISKLAELVAVVALGWFAVDTLRARSAPAVREEAHAADRSR